MTEPTNPLDPMLRARTVAVVGASERSGSVGDQTMRQILGGGFSGSVHPVNPRYERIHGLPSAPSLTQAGEQMDLVVLAVPNASLEDEMEKAVSIGARSVAIFASCHGQASDGGPLRDRLRALADGAGIPICGGNGMGFVNLEHGLRVCGFYQPFDLTPGGVAFLSHSGSLFSAMLHSRRRFGFNLVVSTGAELNTTMDRYLDWTLHLPSTRVIALFLETVRDPDGFRGALSHAADSDIPVVALKVGVSSRGQAAVGTHSEAIAGDDAVYEALFEAHGVHRVESMDEMADTVELFASGRRAGAGTGLGAVHDSGGERAMLIDTAEEVGVSLPSLTPATKARVTAFLDPGLEPENPIDAWGTGRDSRGVFAGCLQALADDPGIGAVAFCVDLTTEESVDEAYSRAVLDVATSTEKPVMVITNLASAVDSSQASALRDSGIPVLEGTGTALRAVGHLFDHTRGPTGEHQRITTPLEYWGGTFGEVENLGRLAAYGIPVPQTAVAGNEGEVVAAAERIGYPVVLKIEGIDHKTDIGGVAGGLRTADQVREAYRDMAARVGPFCVVAQQVGPGVEVALGSFSDPQFGRVVIVGAGGTLVEVLADRVALLPPVGHDRARRALSRLTIHGALAGARGLPPADIDALSDVIVRFSELAGDSAHAIAAIDVNPVIAGAESAVAVDCLMKSL